ncbi:MAG: 50S ribosomal protein L19 [Candidatus Paceibacteria bacterium]
MTVAIEPTMVSPVNVEERKNLGIRAGDTVRVHQKIEEKGKTRIQVFEGLVIAKKHGTEAGATFTVRTTLSGVGVEKIFPLYSPLIDKIEIVRRSKVRRAKLYYIREKVAREIRRQLRNMKLVHMATESEREAAERLSAEESQTDADTETAENQPAGNIEQETAESDGAEEKAAEPEPETEPSEERGKKEA